MGLLAARPRVCSAFYPVSSFWHAEGMPSPSGLQRHEDEPAQLRDHAPTVEL